MDSDDGRQVELSYWRQLVGNDENYSATVERLLQDDRTGILEIRPRLGFWFIVYMEDRSLLSLRYNDLRVVLAREDNVTLEFVLSFPLTPLYELVSYLTALIVPNDARLNIVWWRADFAMDSTKVVLTKQGQEFVLKVKARPEASLCSGPGMTTASPLFRLGRIKQAVSFLDNVPPRHALGFFDFVSNDFASLLLDLKSNFEDDKAGFTVLRRVAEFRRDHNGYIPGLEAEFVESAYSSKWTMRILLAFEPRKVFRRRGNPSSTREDLPNYYAHCLHWYRVTN